ncbi:MAG TPA: hypothetical protein VKP67_10220 [Xanthobacteraceae bacterium]|nr:hypothetical protein [Xanthobacteraceae bacterium]
MILRPSTTSSLFGPLDNGLGFRRFGKKSGGDEAFVGLMEQELGPIVP